MLKNFIVSLIILLFAMFLQTTRAEASEGIVQLSSLNNSNTRCFVMSTLINRSTNYQLQIQCRNLIYPVEPEGMFYILWENPIGKDSKPIRIGDLEFGKSSFNVQNSFSSLFITKEKTQNPDQPSNDKVMEGAVKSIAFLETEPTPTIRPLQTIEPTAKITQIVIPTPAPRKGVNFPAIITTVVIIIAFIFIFGIVFYLIKKVRNS